MGELQAGLVQHESSWYGNSWLRQWSDDRGGPPPASLPLTPPQVRKGARFR